MILNSYNYWTSNRTLLIPGLRCFTHPHTIVTDSLTQDFDAAIELVNGNELARAMRHPNISRAEHNCFRAQLNHLWRLCAEGNCTARFLRELLQQANQIRAGRRFNTVVGSAGIDLTREVSI